MCNTITSTYKHTHTWLQPAILRQVSDVAVLRKVRPISEKFLQPRRLRLDSLGVLSGISKMAASVTLSWQTQIVERRGSGETASFTTTAGEPSKCGMARMMHMETASKGGPTFWGLTLAKLVLAMHTTTEH